MVCKIIHKTPFTSDKTYSNAVGAALGYVHARSATLTCAKPRVPAVLILYLYLYLFPLFPSRHVTFRPLITDVRRGRNCPTPNLEPQLNYHSSFPTDQNWDNANFSAAVALGSHANAVVPVSGGLLVRRGDSYANWCLGLPLCRTQ